MISRVPADLRADRLLRILAVSGRMDLAGAARYLGVPVHQVAALVAELPEVTDDGSGLALDPQRALAVLSAASDEDLEDTFLLVLDAVVGQPDVEPAVVWNLVDLGCLDRRLIDLVLQIDAATPVEDGLAAARVHSLGRRLGWSADDVALRRAEALLGHDKFERCLALCDGVIESGEEPGLGRAVEIAAMAEARLGNLVRAVELHRMHRPSSHDAIASAVASALGIGALEDLPGLAALHGPGATSEVGWSASFVRGMLDTLEDDGWYGVGGLLQAAQAALYATKASRNLPYTPASLAATAALGHGDPVVATTVLEQALAGGSGGDHGRNAHRLGLGWVAMVTGDLDQASAVLTSLDSQALRTPVQATYHRVLRAGIARRAGDRAALDAAWRSLRGALPAIPVNLYTLPLLGELSIAGARLGDPARLDDQMRRGRELLASLGNPPVWSNPFDWAGVQAAIIGERPDTLRPYASALAGNAGRSDFARRLAAAGQAWLDVLRKDVDAVRVARAVADLADTGFGWEASRLAGFAATQCADPIAARELLRLARSADRMRLLEDDSPGENRAAVMLSDREVTVSRLMLQGLGYREIGERLYISPRTVEHHVARIRRRLGADNRREMLERLREILD